MADEQTICRVCAIPTLLSEAALHLFVQTDLSIVEIDAYVDRKWGKREEVYDVVTTLNRQKQTEERDEIARYGIGLEFWSSETNTFSFQHGFRRSLVRSILTRPGR